MNSTSQLSVIRFTPIYQERVWGGRHLESLYGRNLPKKDALYGESWEICDRPEVQSVVMGGEFSGWSLHDLWQKARVEVFGARYKDHAAERFPLLVKILDAQENLSVQVHPDDCTASLLNGEAKSEAWFVTHAMPEARLYIGFHAGTTKEVFAKSLEDGSVINHVNVFEVEEGDCFDIPGGTLHAIGAGLVIFEIQQNSDTTYRVFDWNRLGLDGKPRTLHKEQSMQVLDFESPPRLPQRLDDGRLFESEHFQLKLSTLKPSEEYLLPKDDRFRIGAVVSGEVIVSGDVLRSGDFFIVPACPDAGVSYTVATSQEASLLWISL